MREINDTSVGIGLRPIHYQHLLNSRQDVGWLEVISENYMFSDGRPVHVLDALRKDYPISLHGVSASIGSDRQGRVDYLNSLSRLIDRIEPWIVSDHLCWTGTASHNSFDLLPLPFTITAINKVVDHIDVMQTHLRRRIYFENVSSYIGFEESQLAEVEFINEIVWRSGCGLLLDVNNVYVNSVNFGFDPRAYIDRIEADNIGEIHLAGHNQIEDFLFDTHDREVCDEVWDLYKYTLAKIGSVPTLIEWDEAIPSLDILLREMKTASEVLENNFRESGSTTGWLNQFHYV